MEAVKPLLAAQNAVLTVSDAIEIFGDRVYVKATAIFADCESGETICNTAYAREQEEKKGMDEAQVTGAASSYARKYALNGLFCIDDVKDADTMDNSSSGTKKQNAKQQKSQQQNTQPQNAQPQNAQQQRITLQQTTDLVNNCNQQGVNITALCALYKVQHLDELRADQLDNIIANWDKVKEKCR